MHQILIVDDEEAAVFGYERYLAKRGYRVDSAGSLQEARDRLEADCYQAIILDLRLPDGNALDIIADIRQAHESMVIIVASGLNDEATVDQALRRGANRCVTKPLSMEHICTTLSEQLRQQQ
jgi:DNA-binding response OmpR family regulator